MTFFKRSQADVVNHPNSVIGSVEIPMSEALAKVREFNPEFCKGKSDQVLCTAMAYGGIDTNLNHYWADPFLEPRCG